MKETCFINVFVFYVENEVLSIFHCRHANVKSLFIVMPCTRGWVNDILPLKSTFFSSLFPLSLSAPFSVSYLFKANHNIFHKTKRIKLFSVRMPPATKNLYWYAVELLFLRDFGNLSSPVWFSNTTSIDKNC